MGLIRSGNAAFRRKESPLQKKKSSHLTAIPHNVVRRIALGAQSIHQTIRSSLPNRNPRKSHGPSYFEKDGHLINNILVKSYTCDTGQPAPRPTLSSANILGSRKASVPKNLPRNLRPGTPRPSTCTRSSPVKRLSIICTGKPEKENSIQPVQNAFQELQKGRVKAKKVLLSQQDKMRLEVLSFQSNRVNDARIKMIDESVANAEKNASAVWLALLIEQGQQLEKLFYLERGSLNLLRAAMEVCFSGNQQGWNNIIEEVKTLFRILPVNAEPMVKLCTALETALETALKLIKDAFINGNTPLSRVTQTKLLKIANDESQILQKAHAKQNEELAGFQQSEINLMRNRLLNLKAQGKNKKLDAQMASFFKKNRK